MKRMRSRGGRDVGIKRGCTLKEGVGVIINGIGHAGCRLAAATCGLCPQKKRRVHYPRERRGNSYAGKSLGSKKSCKGENRPEGQTVKPARRRITIGTHGFLLVLKTSQGSMSSS